MHLYATAPLALRLKKLGQSSDTSECIRCVSDLSGLICSSFMTEPFTCRSDNTIKSGKD